MSADNFKKTHYWNYREELTVEDGLIFKAHRLVIPTSLRAEYVKDLHAGHLGEEKTLLRARETVLWPGISDDVRNAVKLCDVCMKYKPAQQQNLCLGQIAAVALGYSVLQIDDRH